MLRCYAESHTKSTTQIILLFCLLTTFLRFHHAIVPKTNATLSRSGRLHLLDGGAAGEGVEGARAVHGHLWGRALTSRVMVALRARAWKVPGPYTAIFGAGRLHRA
jgi:hypothetical protein